MKYLMHFNERMALKDYTTYVKRVALAYKNAPDFEESEKYRWDILNRSNYTFFKRLISKVEIIFTTDDKSKDNTTIEILDRPFKVVYREGEPYKSQGEMKNDYVKNKHLYISMNYSEHPIFSVTDNIVFRTVHDYIVHILSDVDFSAKGEIAAFNAHSKLAPNETIPAIFTEVVGQASYFLTYGSFPKQKIVALKGFDYTNVGAVDGCDIINKELVCRENIYILEFLSHTYNIMDFVEDKFGKELAWLSDAESYDYLFDFDEKRVLKIEGEGYGHERQFNTFNYLKEHSNELPIARIYDVGKISIPLRYLDKKFADRLKTKFKEHSWKMTYTIMEKLHSTKHVSEVLSVVHLSDGRFIDYIGSNESKEWPNMLSRLNVYVRKGNIEMLEKAVEFFEQDEKMKSEKDAIPYAKRVIYILKEFHKHNIDWIDIHAHQFGLNHKGELVAYDIDNYEGDKKYPVKHHIKESYKLNHLKRFNELYDSPDAKKLKVSPEELKKMVAMDFEHGHEPGKWVGKNSADLNVGMHDYKYGKFDRYGILDELHKNITQAIPEIKDKFKLNTDDIDSEEKFSYNMEIPLDYPGLDDDYSIKMNLYIGYNFKDDEIFEEELEGTINLLFSTQIITTRTSIGAEGLGGFNKDADEDKEIDRAHKSLQKALYGTPDDEDKRVSSSYEISENGLSLNKFKSILPKVRENLHEFVKYVDYKYGIKILD